MKQTRIALLLLTLALAQPGAFVLCAYGEDREKKAINDLSGRIAAEPNNPQLYLERAELYRTYLSLDRSIADSTHAIALKPSVAAYVSRARAYREYGKLNEARADLAKGASLDPKAQNVFDELGSLEASQRHYDQAIKAYSQLLKLNPDRAVERQGRAEAYLQLHKPAEALKDMNIALKSNPDPSGSGHAVLGQAYMQLKQYQPAVAAFSASLAKNRVRASVRKARAEAYDKLGKPELAAKDRRQIDEDFTDAFDNAPFRRKL